MSFLLRLCLGLVVLVPSLAHAATLENPGNGFSYSGVGVVSGWKCESSGSLTVSFLDGDMMPVGDPVPLVYGTERDRCPSELLLRQCKCRLRCYLELGESQ